MPRSSSCRTMPRRRTFEDPLYLPDSEIALRVSMGTEEWIATATILERSGLPRRDPLFKHQRCWWRVQDFLYRRAGGTIPDAAAKAGGVVEDIDALRPKRGRRPHLLSRP